MTFTQVLAILGATSIFYLVRTWYNRGLNRFPGPPLAALTDLWGFFDVRRGHHHETSIRLHRKYGGIVRTGPNCVSLSDHRVIPLIFGVNRGFVKGVYYDAFQTRLSGKEMPMMFPMKDEELHSRIKRPIAAHFSMSGLVKFEPLIDEVIVLMMRRLKDLFASGVSAGRICHMDHWVQFFAFDVVTKITFGKCFGFLEAGKDLHNLIERLDETIDEDAPISHLPWLGYFHKKSPLARFRGVDSSPFPIFVRKHIALGQQRRADREIGSFDDQTPQKTFLDYFLDAQGLHSESVDDAVVWSYSLTNVVAGSDTVAIPLRSILYYVLRDDYIHMKLLKELDGADLQIPVSWSQAHKLPYLDAVVQEALRIHPPVGLGLERVVPSGGLRLPTGEFLQEGTEVSVNAWVVHRRKEIFGQDADEYRPERWLQGEKENLVAYQERLAEMKKAIFTFGHGSRACIGKNLSYIEIYKLIPTLLLTMELEIVEAKWVTWNSWFVRQAGLDIRHKLRKEKH